jgi:hypothetical protein
MAPHKVLAIIATSAFIISTSIAQTCGLGQFTCNGYCVITAGDQAGTTFPTGINESDFVSKIDNGFYHTNITSGDFVEQEYCTLAPGNGNEVAAGSTLLCVTGTRSDQQDPHVTITVKVYTVCSVYKEQSILNNNI